MAAIKLVEDYQVAQARKDVRDSLIMAGEEVILLSMYHVSTDQNTHPRCPVCWNAPLNSAKREKCSYCYGTTFEGGIKEVRRVWALFSDNMFRTEEHNRYGRWAPDNRTMQCEAFPRLIQGDYVVRVRRWSSDHRPLELQGVYVVHGVDHDSIRTGSRFGQWSWDVIGQRCDVTEMSENSAIYEYPILNQKFDEFGIGIDQEQPPVVQPDEKVLYYPVPVPVETTPPAGETIFGVSGFTYIQNIPAAVWTITNPLGRYPASVTVLIAGEVVETDEEYPDINTIVLRFAEPQTGQAEVV